MEEIDRLRGAVVAPNRSYAEVVQRLHERAPSHLTISAAYPAIFQYFLGRVPQLVGETAGLGDGPPVVLTSWTARPATVQDLATLGRDEAEITLIGRHGDVNPGPVLTVTLFNLGTGGTGLLFSPMPPVTPPPGLALHRLFALEIAEIQRHWGRLDDEAKRQEELAALARDISELQRQGLVAGPPGAAMCFNHTPAESARLTMPIPGPPERTRSDRVQTIALEVSGVPALVIRERLRQFIETAEERGGLDSGGAGLFEVIGPPTQDWLNLFGEGVMLSAMVGSYEHREPDLGAGSSVGALSFSLQPLPSASILIRGTSLPGDTSQLILWTDSPSLAPVVNALAEFITASWPDRVSEASDTAFDSPSQRPNALPQGATTRNRAGPPDISAFSFHPASITGPDARLLFEVPCTPEQFAWLVQFDTRRGYRVDAPEEKPPGRYTLHPACRSNVGSWVMGTIYEPLDRAGMPDGSVLWSGDAIVFYPLEVSANPPRTRVTAGCHFWFALPTFMEILSHICATWNEAENDIQSWYRDIVKHLPNGQTTEREKPRETPPKSNTGRGSVQDGPLDIQTGASARLLTDEEIDRVIATMTERDAQIVRLWRAGRSDSQIASRLKTQSSTVRNQVYALRKRHGDQVVPYHGRGGAPGP